jgi:hypothetical protein
MDVVEKNSEKIFNEMKEDLYRRKKKKPFKPEEVAKVFGKVGDIMLDPPQLPSPDVIKGDVEAGKETFGKIAGSVSDSDRQNFHFYPPLTDEGRTEMEKKEQEENRNDPVLEGMKINAIAEIKSTLDLMPSVTSELSNENQNWEERIKESKKIIEIEKIKRRVLADIGKKRYKKNQLSTTKVENDNKFPIN